jgi:sugar phosphate permease
MHYGWTVLAIGTLGVFGALGLARFGYTTILPAMQSDLGINNEQAGLLATFNLFGYLALSMIGGALSSKYGARLTASLGLLLAGAGMIFTGLAHGFAALAVWRMVTGVGSGAANMSIMGLWPGWFSIKKRGLASGIAVTGSSFALIFTGIYVPRVLTSYGETAWRNCWYIYGLITIILAICSFLLIRNSASEKGLNLIGNNNKPLSAQHQDKKTKLQWKRVYLSVSVWYLGFIYMAFGFSYIFYTTFFVKYLVADHEYTSVEAGNLFMLLGWFSLLCGLVWGIISDRIGRKTTLILLFFFNTAAFSLFAFGSTHFHLTLSAIIYGLSAWGVPAIMAAKCGDMLGRSLAPAALGFITLFFGIGQAVGPTAAGAIADASGSFSKAFIVASVVSLAGALGSALLIKKEQSVN